MPGSVFRLRGLVFDFVVWDFRFCVACFGFWILGDGFWVWDLRFGVLRFGFRNWSLGSGVWGWDLRYGIEISRCGV